MHNDRNWSVLFIGGASGTGKSSIAYEIGRFYGEADTREKSCTKLLNQRIGYRRIGQ